MKLKITNQTMVPFATLLALLFATSVSHAVDYTWRGTNSSVWADAGNWLGGVICPTNQTVAGGRLNVNNAAFSPCVYDASLGTTILTGAGRGVVIGSGGSGSGILTINGGTLITTNTGNDIIQNTTGNSGTLNVNGGSYLSYTAGVNFGLGTGNPSTAIMNVSGGYVQMNQPIFNVLSGTINYNGGITCFSNMVRSAGNITNNFNGGTLRALANSAVVFIPATVNANVRDGGAVIDTAGFGVTIAASLIHSPIAGDAAIDGGLTKNGAGTLTLTGANNTYTGPTVVNQGSLVGLKLPSSSSALTVADGAAVTIAVNDSSWLPASVNVTNAAINFAFGGVVSLPSSIITATLNASGSNVINITSGAGLPVGVTKLIDHGGTVGGGTFTLGTLPAGMQATLTNGPTSVDLNVTSSVQALIWSAGTAEWATNGALNWNSGTAAYQEYLSGFGDLVTFSDAAGTFYTVSITNDVKPLDVLVNIPTAAVTFSGVGKISGATGLSKSGAGILTLANTNSFDGVTTISGGTLQILNGSALGSTVGGSSASGGATLAVGDGLNTGVTVTGETITISGAGVGGARGALRGADAGNNVWAGPVIIASNESRIGTEDNSFLEVSGSISDAATNNLILRPGAGGTLVISGAGNNYGSTKTFCDLSGTGVVKLGADNALCTNRLDVGKGPVDLNGHNQTIGGLVRFDSNGPGSVKNDGAGASVLTINTSTNNYSADVDLVDGVGSLSIVKLGGGQQTLNAANLTYSGATIVSEGRLHLAPTNAMVSSISVAASATLSGEPTTSGSLTLAANSALITDPSTPGSLTANTVSATAGPIKVSFSSAFLAGDALVLAAPSGITGSAGNFQAIGVRGGTFYLTNSNTELYFSPAAGPTLVWKGNDPTSPTFWNTTTTTNWDNSGSPDIFYTGDVALFNDTASTNDVVVQGGSVAPASVLFNNSVNNYTVSGGAISGTATLTKSGVGTVTLSGNNTYSGVTVVEGGTLIAQNNNALGAKTAGTVITNGGTLDLGGNVFVAGFNLGTEVLTVSGAGVGGAGAVVNNSVNAQINAVQQMVLAGNASIGGSTRWDIRGTGNALDMGGFNLTKTGPGFVGWVGTKISNPGNIDIAAGTLSLQLTNDLGGSAANTLTVRDGGTLSFYQYQLQSGWSLILNSNATVGCENFLASNGGTNHWVGPVTMSGVVNFAPASSMSFGSGLDGDASIIKTGTGYVRLFGTNTYTGDTTINGGRIIYFTASIATNSTVTVTNGAAVDLQFADTNLVTGLVLNGVVKGPGVYNNVTDPTFLLGTGSLRVAGSVIPTTPTNITYSVTSSNITLGWPAEYTGWYLQSQTNSLSVGLSSNWTDVVGSETTNSVTLPVSVFNPSVFFRMVHTNTP
jgi:autotransporter-associated beta strand protein